MNIGIDIVHIPRIKNTLEKWGEKFLNRVFSADELSYCTGKKNYILCLAGRFAAKEAVYKVLGRPIALKDISIRTGGIPEVFLHGKKEPSIKVSISHQGEYAIAVAVKL